MDFIRSNQQSFLGSLRANFHLPRRRFGVQDVDRAVDDFIEVELLPVDLAPFLEHVSTANNDVTCSLIVIPDVSQNLLDEIQVRVFPFNMAFAASALLRIAPSGWFSSWAIDADYVPAVADWFICTNSSNLLRACISADTLDRRSAYRARMASACVSSRMPTVSICHRNSSHAPSVK